MTSIRVRDESLLTTLVGQHLGRDHIRSGKLAPGRMAPPPEADRGAPQAPPPRHSGVRTAFLRVDAPARPRQKRIRLRRKRLRKRGLHVRSTPVDAARRVLCGTIPPDGLDHSSSRRRGTSDGLNRSPIGQRAYSRLPQQHRGLCSHPGCDARPPL